MSKILEKLRKMKVGESLVIAMTNLRTNLTGLPMVIWIQPKTGKEKHGPRIKVQKDHGDKVNIDNWVSVTISDTPVFIPNKLSSEDEKLIRKFIKLNQQSLLDLWEDKIDPIQFSKNIKKIK